MLSEFSFFSFSFFICSSFSLGLLSVFLELHHFKYMAFGGWRISVEAGVAVNLHRDSSILPRSVSKGWNGSKRFLRRLNGYNRHMLLFRGLLVQHAPFRHTA